MNGDVNNDSDILNTTINYDEVEQSTSFQYLRWSASVTKKKNEDSTCHSVLIDITEERIMIGFSTVVKSTMYSYKEENRKDNKAITKKNTEFAFDVPNRISAFSTTVAMDTYKNIKEYKFHYTIIAGKSSIERKICHRNARQSSLEKNMYHRLDWLTEPGNNLVNENEAFKNVIDTAGENQQPIPLLHPS